MTSDIRNLVLRPRWSRPMAPAPARASPRDPRNNGRAGAPYPEAGGDWRGRLNAYNLAVRYLEEARSLEAIRTWSRGGCPRGGSLALFALGDIFLRMAGPGLAGPRGRAMRGYDFLAV